MTRTVNGEIILDSKAKEILRRSLWRSAAFCGVRLLNYCIMDNHFHVLLGIDPLPILSDEELIAKVRAFYTHPGEAHHRVRLIGDLQAGGQRREQTRRLLLARMSNLPAFMKIVKQRFSRWYNRQQSRFGTLYADRYRSVLLEGGSGWALATVAAYIALNPIRAGLVKRPENYRFSGYAEAMAGNKAALLGMMELTDRKDAQESLRAFRECLYGKGAMPNAHGSPGGRVEMETAAQILSRRGAIATGEALRCRIRYFTDGLILGRTEYISEMLSHLREKGMHPSSKWRPMPVHGAADWGELATIRPMRGRVYG